MGKQAVDGDSNQVGQILAELLDWPMATFAATIKEEARRARSSAARSTAASLTLRVTLPAVVTVDLRIVAPTSVYSSSTPRRRFKYNDGVRFAALPAIMAAKKKPLVEMKLADLAADTALKITYTRLRAAARAQGRHQGEGRRRARREAQDRSQGPLRLDLQRDEGNDMANILVVAELAEGKLKKTTHSAITFAQQAAAALGGTFSILVIGARREGRRGGGRRRSARAKVLVADDAVARELRWPSATRPRSPPSAKAASTSSSAPRARSARTSLPRVAARARRRLRARHQRASLADGGKLSYKRPMFAGNAYGICDDHDAGPGRQRAAERVRGRRAGGRRVARSRRSPSRPPTAAAARVEFVSLDAGEERAPRARPRPASSSPAAAR